MRPAETYFKLFAQNNPVTICECGVLAGKHAMELYKNFNCEKLILIDQWVVDYEHYHIIQMLDYYQNVINIFADKKNVEINCISSLEYDNSDLRFDFIYLDDNHTYEHIIKEIPKYWPMLKNGGVLAGDNYEIPGVKKAVDEWYLQYLREPNGWGITADLHTAPYKKAAGSGIDVKEWWIRR
jgi:hypothetical protein